MSAEQHGKHYWCVKVPRTISQDGEIYLVADEVEFRDGGVVFYGCDEEKRTLNLALADGAWKSVYAASYLDGHAVAVTHWKGEVAA